MFDVSSVAILDMSPVKQQDLVPVFIEFSTSQVSRLSMSSYEVVQMHRNSPKIFSSSGIPPFSPSFRISFLSSRLFRYI